MLEFTDQKKKDILSFVKKITDKSIGTNIPKGFCFSTCYALSIYLKSQGVDNSIVSGKMGIYDHFWINLTHYENIIIDATIRQFDPKQKSIYIGIISDNEVTRKYVTECMDFSDWIKNYDIWSKPSLNQHGLLREEEDFVRTVVKHNLLNASIILYEIESQPEHEDFKIMNSLFYKIYFNAIFNLLKNGWINDEGLVNEIENIVEKEFEFLVTKLFDNK